MSQSFLLIDEVQVNAVVELITDSILRVDLSRAIDQHAVLQDKQGIGRTRDIRVKRTRTSEAEEQLNIQIARNVARLGIDAYIVEKDGLEISYRDLADCAGCALSAMQALSVLYRLRLPHLVREG